VVSEGKIRCPSEITTFYLGIGKYCSASTGSEWVACSVSVLVCIVATILGLPHQGPFLVACATATRNTNKLNQNQLGG